MTLLTISLSSLAGNPFTVSLDIKDNWRHFWKRSLIEAEFYQALANDVINQPYVDQPHDLVSSNGVTLFRPNHDVGHSLRQVTNSQFLFELIKHHGHPDMKMALKQLTQEETAAVYLAAFLYRAARTNEHGSKIDPSHAQRSAQLFTKIATQVGFNKRLIDNIAYGVGHYGSIMDKDYAKDIPCSGFKGTKNIKQSKSRLIKAVLDVGHHSDLVRCWGDINDIVPNNLKNLAGLLQVEDLNVFNAILLNFSRSCNAITGSGYFKDDDSALKFMPPVQLRIKAATQVSDVLDTLKGRVDQWVPIALNNQLEASNKELSHIELLVNEETVESQAANTIKRAFRIHRAHKVTKQAVGIVPSIQSQISLNFLKKDLREGISTPEQAATLNDDGLLPEELDLYHYLLHDFDWVLKHITDQMPVIQANGNALKSLHQRSREGQVNEARHTSDQEGRSDAIFFTISSPNSSGADFLQLDQGHEIRLKLRSFVNKEGVPCDKLSGLWISSSWFDYLTTGQIHSKVDNVKRVVKYVKQNRQNHLLDKEDYKEYQWEYSDGKKITRKVPFGFETVSGKELLPFLALNTIAELRHTTPEFRLHCLEKPSSPELEAFVDLIYTMRNFEALIPATLPLNDPRVEILPFNQVKDVGQAMARKMKEALDSGNLEDIEALIRQGCPIDLQVQPGVTPLGYCLQVKTKHNNQERTTKALYLIDKGANIAAFIRGHSILTLATLNSAHLVAEAILSNSLHDKRTDKVQSYLDINADEQAVLTSIQNQDFSMLDLFVDYGLSIKSIPQGSIILLSNMNEKNALSILRYMLKNGFQCRPQFQQDRDHLAQALINCIKHQRYQLLEEFIAAGCKPKMIGGGARNALLDYAKKTGDERANQLLNDAGFDVLGTIESTPLKIFVKIQDNQGRTLVLKQRRDDGSLCSFWQAPHYTSRVFLLDDFKESLFLSTGLRPMSFDIKMKKLGFQEKHKILVVELVIYDDNFLALDTEEFAQPRWLTQDESDKLPLSSLAQSFVSNASEQDLWLAFSLYETLLEAVKTQDSVLLKACFRRGVIDENQIALFKACDLKFQNLELINILIDNGYDVNAVDDSGNDPMTALMYAILHENIPLVEFLIHHGAQPNQAVGDSKETPLMFAARLNNLNILEILEKNGASYGHPANEGILAYAMLLLCSNQTFKYLVERANCEGFYFQYAPLFIAAKAGHDERIKLLIDQNVDITKIDPITRNPAWMVYKGNQPDLLRLQKSDSSTRDLWELSTDYKIHLVYSGAWSRNNIDEELANEYLLTIVNANEHKALHSFLNEVVNQCQLKNPNDTPVFAIAHEGQSYVRTCSGFSKPVISIHREFFANESLTLEHLAFAIAHEIFLLEKLGERQFNQVSQRDRMQADQSALEKLANQDAAFDYLQQLHSFVNRHQNLNINEKPDYFIWSIHHYVDDDYYIRERLKGLKIVSNVRPRSKEAALNRASDSHQVVQEVQRCQALNYFPRFNEFITKRQQLDYLKTQLHGLDKEFISYAFVQTARDKNIASQKLKQFCELVKKCEFDDDMKHELIEAVHESGVHSFEYIYKSIVNLSPVRKVCYYKPIPYCQPFTFFKDMYQASQAFVTACKQGCTFSQVSQAAKKIMELLPLVLPHVGSYHRANIDLLNGFKQHHPDNLKSLTVESDVACFIDWPHLDNLNLAKQYLSKDRDGTIWKVLWMMGFYKEQDLLDHVPVDTLQTVYQWDGASDLIKQGVHLFPFLRPDILDGYLFDAKKAIQTYLLNKSKPDLSMLNGSFISNFEWFYKVNKPFLLRPDCQYYRELVQVIANEIQALLKGNALEQVWVFKMYDVFQSIYMILHESGNKEHPLIKVLIEGANQSNRFQVLSTINGLPKISKDVKWELVKQVLKLDDYQDDFSIFVAYTEYYLTCSSSAVDIDTLWNLYFQRYPQLQFDTRIMRILERFNEIDSTRFISPYITFRGVDFSKVPLLDCIRLYRILDKDFAMTALRDRELLTYQIRQGLNELKSLDQKIFCLEQLVFIDQSPSGFVLTDKAFLDELNLWLGESYAKKYGLDDGTKGYLNKIESTITSVYAKSHTKDAHAISRSFSETILSQELVSKRLGQWLEPQLYGDYFQKRVNDYTTITSVFSVIGGDFKDKHEAMEFFSSTLTEKTLSRFTHYMKSGKPMSAIVGQVSSHSNVISEDLIRYVLIMLHQEFWGLDIQSRAVLLDSLLITSEEEAKPETFRQAYEFGFDFLANKLFQNAQTDEREAFALSLLKSYLKVADHFERQFLLSGILVTSNESEGQKATIGRKLALLCEHMGPAYVKLAQAIHSHPDTPEDIKQDLQHIKGRANPPNRWQLWRHLKDTLPEDVYKKIQYLGELLGSASYNLAVACHYDDQPDKVVVLLRENAAKDAEKGFAHLRKTIDHNQHPLIKKSKQTFLYSIDEAETLSHWEINNDVSNIQFGHAERLYDSKTEEVDVNQDIYTVHFRVCKNQENGPGFKVLTRMPGDEFNDLTDVTVKQAIAKAVMKREFSILLSGDVFDSDRHGSQYRVTIEGHHIYLGLYDFGEMSLERLTDLELESFARLVKSLPGTLKNKGSISDLFQAHIKKAVEEGRPYRHLMRVNKALLALNDFSQYLSQQDMVLIIQTILPDMHPVLSKAMRQGWYESSSYLEMLSSFSMMSSAMSDTISENIEYVRGLFNQFSFNRGSEQSFNSPVSPNNNEEPELGANRFHVQDSGLD